MKKFILLLLLISVSMAAFAQTVKVKKEKSTVKGESLDGFSVELEGTFDEVNAAFLKLARTLGKTKKTEFITVSEPNLNGLTSPEPFYGVTTANARTTSAWLGFNISNLPKEETDKLNKELENTMKDFGVKFYRDKIQVQIDESMAATQSVDRQKQRLINENKILNTKLEDNKKEKIQLKKALEQNRLDSIAFVKKIALNKRAQDSVSVAAEQIKKVLESQKEKQRKVN